MAYYRHYFLDQNNRISRVEPGEFESDEAAIAFAHSTHFGSETELWNENRHVATLRSEGAGSIVVMLVGDGVVKAAAE